MIDFERVVGRLLVEMDGKPPTGPESTKSSPVPADKLSTEEPEITKTADGEIGKVDIANFFKKTTQYSIIQKEFTAKYKDKFPFPNEQEFLNIAWTAVNAFSRNTKDSEKYPNLMDYYPILDLFASLFQILKGGGGDATEGKLIVTKFLEKIKDPKTSSIPLDYLAMNQWARDVKADHFTNNKQDIGQARLEAITPKDMGIYSTILYLLAIRRKMFAPKVPIDKIPVAPGFIKSIFFDSQFYIKGQKPMPGKDIELLYNDTSCSLLLKLAQAAYELFIQQKISILNADEQLPNEAELYAAFMGDGTSSPAKAMRWSDKLDNEKSSETGSTPFKVGESFSNERNKFDKTFKELFEALINEASFLDPDYVDPEKAAARGNIIIPGKVEERPDAEIVKGSAYGRTKRTPVDFNTTFIFPALIDIIQNDTYKEINKTYDLKKLNDDKAISEEELVKKYPELAFSVTYNNYFDKDTQKSTKPPEFKIQKIQTSNDKLPEWLKENKKYTEYVKTFPPNDDVLIDAISLGGETSSGIEKDELHFFTTYEDNISEELEANIVFNKTKVLNETLPNNSPSPHDYIIELSRRILEKEIGPLKPTKTTENKKLRPFEVIQNGEADWFKYSLDLITKHQQEVPQAGNFRRLLVSLADFIAKETSPDWVGAIKDIGAGVAGLKSGTYVGGGDLSS